MDDNLQHFEAFEQLLTLLRHIFMPRHSRMPTKLDGTQSILRLQLCKMSSCILHEVAKPLSHILFKHNQKTGNQCEGQKW